MSHELWTETLRNRILEAWRAGKLALKLCIAGVEGLGILCAWIEVPVVPSNVSMRQKLNVHLQ